MATLSRGTIAEHRRSLKVAIQAAASATALLARGRGRGLQRTAGREVKLIADARLDRHIVSVLSRESDWPILSEESGWTIPAATGGYRWIVDPLDGSFNYMRGVPFCAVSIGLWDGVTPVLGIIHDSVHNEVFTGIVGVGAWLNGRKISTSRVRQSSGGILATGFPVSTDLSAANIHSFVEGVQRFQKVRSGCLDRRRCHSPMSPAGASTCIANEILRSGMSRQEWRWCARPAAPSASNLAERR
jgi:myo-inositol-1(or 4)-monophosphatase